MKDHIVYLDWAKQILNNRGDCIENSKIILSTPWSYLIKIQTQENIYFLKKTPELLSLEFMTMKFIYSLSNKTNEYLPKPIANNQQLNCFLMKSCGDISLRTYFDGKLDENLLTVGLNNYIYIMRNLETQVDKLTSLGIPDWRINKFTDLYIDFISNKQALLDDGLTPNEIKRLPRLSSAIDNLCNKINSYNIPETLAHCDFHENNMVINKQNAHVSIIDWGETVISHPFFPLVACLRNTANRYSFSNESAIYTNFRNNCLSHWETIANQQELINVFDLIKTIHPLFAALTHLRLQSATNFLEMKNYTANRWKSSGWLKGCCQFLLTTLDKEK